ncbi:hypothetical protein TBR22_A42200 [Luteitalea sp. TBR-22]|uniref:protein kinase domain-containing protein n=1 Tax=Luteitalea sp. TBR-22 TaxID=2802971 RepID=UPI001AF47C6E|nr:protein kinase [Luteitalea sp. TBR-22]BCS34994.1 hypothetical protein TBR22_A42200 [Luteitalea sp. TBR-22]
MSLPAGTAIGPYTIVAPLGTGGMGEVYRAHDATLHRDVAIKLLPDAFANDNDRVARVLREAQVLASLNHPGIAGIYGIESFRGTHALVMELVAGDDLATLLERGPLAPEDALPIARQVAAALEAAHEQGVVHRDLKPGNIKVRADGSAKVLDFGLAKAQAPGSAPGRDGLAATLTSPTLTAQGLLLGTPAYMAPEQARGRAVDKRADIWAFGVVLYEMLTGVCPFREDSVAATLAAVLTKEVDLGAIPETVPASVTALIARCLERDPQVRLRDIGEARVALAAPAPSNGPLVRAPQPTSAPAAPSRSYTRRELIAMAAGGTALFGGGLAAGLIVPRRGSEPVAPLLVRPLTASGLVISASISPDGRYLAYVESEHGQQSLWVRQVATGQTLRLMPEDSVAYWSHTFTPDGNAIVFGQKSRTQPTGALFSISPLGGTPRLLVEGMDTPPTFSPDGARMAFVRARTPDPEHSALMVCNRDGSAERVLAAVKLPESMADVFFGAPSWSPDGTTIAVAVGTGLSSRALAVRGARLALVDATSGAMRTLGPVDWLHVGQCAWLPDGRSLLAIARPPSDPWSQVWSIDASTGATRRVTTGTDEFRIVSLTADGRTLVSVQSTIVSTMSTMPMAGGALRRLGRTSLEGGGGLACLPDGRLAFASLIDQASSIWTTTPDGATRSVLVDARAGEFLSFPAASDDGGLAFVAMANAQLELRWLPAGASRARVVTRDLLADGIAVSPDGRTLVFSASIKGEPRLFRCATDGSDRRQISSGWASTPAIGPDGRTVAYFGTGNGGFRIKVASLDTGDVLSDLPSEPPPSGFSTLALTGDGVLTAVMPGDRGNVWLRPLDGSPARKLTPFAEQEIFRFAVSRDGATLVIVRGSRLRDAQMITGFDPAT